MQLCIQNDRRMDKMEDRFSKLYRLKQEKPYKKKLSSSKVTYIVIVSCMKEDIISIVDERNRELDKRRNKANNKVFFNNEDTITDINRATMEDRRTVEDISNLLI